MDPAYSVIIFTSSSGAGYGLLIWLALARLTGAWEIGPVAAVVACLVALALVTTGLLSSTFHLGHPERAWRAMTQWRSSWLSREGVFAVLVYPAALVFTAGWIWDAVSPALMMAAALATLVLSLITVYCTSMIYASLKTIPRWSNGFVPPVYLIFALASGGLLFAVLLGAAGAADMSAMVLLLVVLLAAWLIKWYYWRFIDEQKVESDPGTATGLGHLGKVTQLEAPHTSENYLLKEMGFQVARRHATKLRRYALLLGMVVPAVLLIVAGNLAGAAQIATLIAALLIGLGGVIVERWLFFAEARHLVTLFYGRTV
ncbi:MAG: dimethyl sulfoxide reductase anchor subunit [Xanthomonadales bacterium]